MKHFIHETFKDFPLGEFPYDFNHSAIGEYHYYPVKGYTGNWYDPIDSYQWRSMGGSWIVTEENNKRYMEQNRGSVGSGYFKDTAPLLIYKSGNLEEYTISVELRLLALDNYAGIVFNYVHSRKYYALVIENKKIKVYFQNQKEKILLGEKEIAIDEYTHYVLKADVKHSVMIYLNNAPILNFANRFLKKGGKVGLISSTPCQYTDFIVSLDEVQNLAYEGELKSLNNKLEEKKTQISKMALIHKIDLKNFGSGRQLRKNFIDGKLVMIIAQHQKRLYRDAFAHISCLTAFDLDGNILWQFGEANNTFDNTVISCDLPFQFYDLDNDGVPEVIFAYNFEIIILNGKTGEIKRKMKTPEMKEYPFNRLNVDAICLADFSKVGYKSDFIIKDRYQNIFAYNRDFNLLWRYKCRNTGHFPFIGDINKDSKDEMLIGYDLVNSDGKMLWKLPINDDHTDEIIFDNKNNRFYLASGFEDFNIVDITGKIIKRIPVGHAQRISLAPFHQKENEVCVTSFWGAQNIIYLFDELGNLIWEKEFAENGNVITPINYDGKNILILLSGFLGLMDKDGDIVLNFPDDDHPTLCSDVFDLDHDGIDEIILWDQTKMYIYKSIEINQSETFIRSSIENSSNYRGEFLIKVKK